MYDEQCSSMGSSYFHPQFMLSEERVGRSIFSMIKRGTF